MFEDYEWFDQEVEALENQLLNGHITQEEYRRSLFELRQDLEEAQYRDDMIAAGRGHLLR